MFMDMPGAVQPSPPDAPLWNYVDSVTCRVRLVRERTVRGRMQCACCKFEMRSRVLRCYSSGFA